MKRKTAFSEVPVWHGVRDRQGTGGRRPPGPGGRRSGGRPERVASVDHPRFLLCFWVRVSPSRRVSRGHHGKTRVTYF